MGQVRLAAPPRLLRFVFSASKTVEWRKSVRFII
jgi:hypothetical protein